MKSSTLAIMKRFLFLFSAWIFLLSCTQNTNENSVLSSQGSEPVSPYAISESEALQSLAVALQQIDGEDETRAGGVRKPLSIRSVKASDVFETTRSADIPDLDNLLYVVSFGEGNGSAVLGADRRVSPIFAILDETVLTPEDLTKKENTRVTGSESDIRVYLSNLLQETGERDALIADVSARDFPPIEQYRKGYRDTIVYRNFLAPMIHTKWDQDDPYNKYCPPKSDPTKGNCPAGCAPIAFAQLMCALPYPDPLIVEGVVFDRNVLMNNVDEAAWYCRVIGIPLRTAYTDNESPTTKECVAETMRNLGWPEAGVTAYNYDNARVTIYVQRKPFYTRGSTAAGDGHAWLIDGWDSYTRQIWEITYSPLTGAAINETLYFEESFHLVHCNFGWKGDCDGYYAHHVFDTRYRLNSKYVDSEIGDIISTNTYLFDRQFAMIGY